MTNQDIAPVPSIIHYDPQRTDFTVTEDELTRIRESSNSSGKDFTLVSVSLAIPTMINAIAATKDPFELSLSLFLNYLIGSLSLILALVFGIMWRRTRLDFDSVIDQIRDKPRYLVQVSQSSGNIAAQLILGEEERPSSSQSS